MEEKILNSSETTITQSLTETNSPLEGCIATTQQEILFDWGKELVKNSVTNTVEFHKTMLGLTATFVTLMASAFGILAFGIKDRPLNNIQTVILAVPVVLMLISSVFFALGYYPHSSGIILNDLDNISEIRNKLLNKRRNWAFVGIGLFVLSIIGLVVGIIFFNLTAAIGKK